MKKLALLAIVGLALSVPTQAHAVYIVDTGTPVATPTGGGQWSLFYQSDALHQWIAGQFITPQDYTVTSIEGYIRAGNPTGGTVDAVLYFDNAGSVDLVGEIFRQSINIPSSTGSEYAWRGLFGLNENLTAGTYWLAFETTDTALASAMLGGAPDPLAKYAGNYDIDDGWEDYPFNVGMRIDARPTGNAVPEPMSMLLFGTGLVGAAIRKRFNV